MTAKLCALCHTFCIHNIINTNNDDILQEEFNIYKNLGQYEFIKKMHIYDLIRIVPYE